MKHIATFVDNKRLSTRGLLQRIYSELEAGETEFIIEAAGQHDIGGPLWNIDDRPLKFIVRNPGQRVGSMGMPGTDIIVEGSAPADVGWLNAGATITIKGDGGDTTGHSASSGVIYIGGRAGSRTGSLMKHDPAYPAPQLWILKNTGSFSFEFMGGGVAIVCGYECEDLHSIIGQRPCIGMVGGVVFVRGPIDALASNVTLIETLSDEDWVFLGNNLPRFLVAIERTDLVDPFLCKNMWRKIVPKTEVELKQRVGRVAIKDYHSQRWILGGLFGNVVKDTGEIIPLVPSGNYRTFSPVWNNAVFAAPCEYACPCGIPTQDRINLLRKGKIREALEFVLQYSPFPGSVCGAACPNPCMTACTRQTIDFAVLAGPLGKLSMDLRPPLPASPSGKKVSIIGGGVGGLSAAWHLAQRGHDVTIFERNHSVGGKITHAIPHERLGKDVVNAEIRRILSLGIKIETDLEIDDLKFETLRKESDGIIIAIGAHHSRLLPFPGSNNTIPALPFLISANANKPLVDPGGRSVVVIGAGNVGMDVCFTAWKFGAKSVTAVDIQKPAATSRELTSSYNQGTQIIWPRVIREYKNRTLFLEDGDSLPADLVFVSVGEVPATDWLPDEFTRVKGNWLKVDESGRTNDPKVYAVGDVVKPGLLAEAIGKGRIAAMALHAHLMGDDFKLPRKAIIPHEKLHLTYFTPRLNQCPVDPLLESERCISCGTCRDCNICVHICGQGAISRVEQPNGTVEFLVDEARCIGCGFCEAACPSGIWKMVPNLLGELSGEKE